MNNTEPIVTIIIRSPGSEAMYYAAMVVLGVLILVIAHLMDRARGGD